MADPVLVKMFLKDIEDKRKSGRAVEPPKRLAAGNLLGGKTKAFIEAVKQQGQKLNPKAADPNADIEAAQSPLRKTMRDKAKKATTVRSQSTY